MSNPCDQNAQPSTSQSAPTDIPLPLCSLANEMKELTVTESTSQEIPDCGAGSFQCHDNTSVVNATVDDHNIEQTVVTKKRNARKRAKLKLIKSMGKSSNDAVASTSVNPNENIVGSERVSIKDIFLNQIAPMYASTSSRYLENITHHPQYQYLHQPHFREIKQNRPNRLSAPNTPEAQSYHLCNDNNISSSSISHSEPGSPRYLQNLMQHPLLCQNLSININCHENQSHLRISEGHRQEKKSKQKKKKNENHNFEAYLSLEEVNVGLSQNTFFEGVIRINPKQFHHSYVSSSYDRNEQDILIDGIKNRNRALEGDVVVVKILEDSETEGDKKQKKGKVVYIKEKLHPRSCIGLLRLMPDGNRRMALLMPRDNRFPKLNIPYMSWPDNFYQDSQSYEKTLFSAKIIDWFDIRFALGNINCIIGESGDMMSETKAIISQVDLDITPFGPEFRDLYPQSDYTIPDAEIQLREDCRKLCIFSIDPFNCRDIDDAVSCRKLENGNYEIGVHISDVAHFLTEGTMLDEKVAEKATTIYLVERAYHMLPEDLCMLCSLLPGLDKLAFSVFWEITKDAQILSHRFAKTIINSCCQMAYDHCQSMLEEKKDMEILFPEIYNGFQYKDIYDSIKVLGMIAAQLRRNRYINGALRIDQPKISFHLSATNGLPDSFCIYESKESHQLIEELMLLSNMTVAKKIYYDYPDIAFLRCHPPPSGYMMQQLAKLLKPIGVELDISSAGNLHQSLLPHVGPENTDKGKAMVLNMLCAKPMTRAKYFCSSCCEEEDFHHYALNVPLYTHFTSPIRRYADIMVHRLLAASLNYREKPNWEVDKVRMIAAQCNKQKYNAKKAGELSTELYTLKYIEMNSPVQTDAVVVEVREKYIDVIIVAMSLNRRIFFNNDFPGEYKCIKNEAGSRLAKMELTWQSVDGKPEVKQNIEIFSIIQVELLKADDMMKVETKLVRPTE